MIDAVNKYSADVYAVFCFIREYNGCSDHVIFYHCQIQMPLPSHLLMPFYRIKSGRTVTFCSADIYICFKSSDRPFHGFFYLICFCFDNIHLTSPDCLTTSVLSMSRIVWSSRYLSRRSITFLVSFSMFLYRMPDYSFQLFRGDFSCVTQIYFMM